MLRLCRVSEVTGPHQGRWPRVPVGWVALKNAVLVWYRQNCASTAHPADCTNRYAFVPNIWVKSPPHTASCDWNMWIIRPRRCMFCCHTSEFAGTAANRVPKIVYDLNKASLCSFAFYPALSWFCATLPYPTTQLAPGARPPRANPIQWPSRPGYMGLYRAIFLDHFGVILGDFGPTWKKYFSKNVFFIKKIKDIKKTRKKWIFL